MSFFETINLEDDCSIERIIKKPKFFDPVKGQKRYIITGGPKAGKTSIIKELVQLSYACMPEAATDIIEAGIKSGMQKPWEADDYHIKMYQLIMAKQLEAQNSSAPVVLFDRGHLDGISYILLQKRKLYKYIVDCVQAMMDADFFEKKIFFIESLGFVVPGPARNESLEESLIKAECLERSYSVLGYEIIRIFPDKVEQRAHKIIDYIKQWDNNKCS